MDKLYCSSLGKRGVVEALGADGAGDGRGGAVSFESGRGWAGLDGRIDCIRRQYGARSGDYGSDQSGRVGIIAGELRDFLVLIAQPVENPVSASYYQAPFGLVSEADAGRVVVVVAVDDATRVAVFARYCEAGLVDIKEAAAIADIDGLCV